MTKVYHYILLAEGKDFQLIGRMLELIGKAEGIQFVKSNIRIPESANSSKGKILDKVQLFAQRAFITENINLFVAGVDLDKADHTMEAHTNQIGLIEKKIPKEVLASEDLKRVLYCPIQAIESWLYYQMDSKKPEISGSVEKINPDELKRKLYGSSRVDERKAIKIIEGIDFPQLSKQSKSFKHFYDQIQKLK